MIKTGYQKVKFNDLTVLKDVHNKIKLKINKILNKKIELADYHTIGLSDKKHQQVQWKLASYFWKNQLHVRLIRSILPFIEKSLGPDLLVQRKPFLRIARPNEYSDNIGYHKDTIYGQSPYEISIHFPLLDLNRNSCLKFVKGSH